VAETHALILRRLGHNQAAAFLRESETGDVNVIRATQEDEDSGRSVVLRYNDKDFSLTDAISFAVMERLVLRLAFAFDSDFEQYGFEVLRA
jgi:uncharacterized protein